MSQTFNQSKEITYKIHQAVFLLDKMSDQILQTHLKIGFSQFLVLMALADQPKVPQKHVAKFLDQTQAAVSRQVDLLVDLGLVQRDKNPKSRREYILSLTKLGQKKFIQCVQEIDCRFDNLFGVWSVSEKKMILELLNKLVGEIRRLGTAAICGKKK